MFSILSAAALPTLIVSQKIIYLFISFKIYFDNLSICSVYFALIIPSQVENALTTSIVNHDHG